MELDNFTIKVWNKSPQCDCHATLDCEQNHKLCGICGGTMIYGAHESNQPKSKYCWNLDHIVPIARGGNNSLRNRQAVHVKCNRKKGNH